MIRRERGEFVAECDGCGEMFYGGVEEDFREFVQELKDNAWLITRDDDTWEHYCEDCAKDR